MAIYRFRVSFEDYEDVYRDIDMPSKSTFLEFHEAIHKTTGYNVDASSSFYVSNDQWKKGQEIAFLPTQRKIDAGVTKMEDVKMSKFIDDPHQKFYYIYNFDRPYDFQVELIKILKEEDGKEYPFVFKTVGAAPKPVAAANFPVTSEFDDDDDEDLVQDETQYGVDEDEDFDNFDSDDEDENKEDGGEGNENEGGAFDEY